MGSIFSKSTVSPEVQSEIKQCYICLENCDVKSKCSCFSYCHKECYEQYLISRTTNTCPCCRKDLGNIKVFSPYLDEEIKESLLIRIFRLIIDFFNWIIAVLFIILIFGLILPFGFGILISTVIYCLDSNNKNVILFDYVNDNIFWSWVCGFITTLMMTSLCSSKLKKRRMIEQNNRRGRVSNRVIADITETVF
jgi:hypothetical protein